MVIFYGWFKFECSNKDCDSNFPSPAIQFFKVYHQNSRGLKYKIDELLSTLCPDFPHVLCLLEHHTNSTEMNIIILDYYNLGAV
jgi:hypothetical protein